MRQSQCPGVSLSPGVSWNPAVGRRLPVLSCVGIGCCFTLLRLVTQGSSQQTLTRVTNQQQRADSLSTLHLESAFQGVTGCLYRPGPLTVLARAA